MGNKMIVANVLHRPIRTAVSILAVAIEVVMVMLVVGLTNGLLNDSARRTEGIGADVMVQPPGASFFFGLSSAPMPVKIGTVLSQVPHVLAVTPVLFQSDATRGLVNVIYGIDMESWNRVSGGFVYHAGGEFKNPDDIIVDDIYARANHVKIGQTLNLLNHNFRVCAIVEHGKGGRLFIPLATAQDLSVSHDKASIFFVKCTDPAYTEGVAAQFHKLLPGYEVRNMKELMSLMTSNNLPALTTFVSALIGVAVAIGFLVIFLSMYTTITERTREIGILKSLGASKRYILGLILREASLLCAVGIVVGFAATFAARKALLTSFPTLAVELAAVWWVKSAVLAIVGTEVGAFYPALRASQLDPVDALAYE